ncbi:MAG: type VI secretion system baseplate subunit TssF [Methylococcales bacterium]
MSVDNTQYRAFLEELNDLAEFRLNYSLDNPSSGLEGDDPDVKRIIEALAFFGARTQIASLRSLDSSSKRLYQQFFSYLLTPLAAMAMAEAQPTGHLTEVLDIPVGTELSLQPDRGGRVMFCSTRALRILPMSLASVKQDLGSEKASRLLLTFQANYPLNEQPETVSLYVNYLNDLISSLKVWNFLKSSLSSAKVQFGEYDPDVAGANCDFNLGIPEVDMATDEWHHPLESERYYFHFPQQELYLDLKLPNAPRNWRQFTVILDFDKPWPRALRLNRNVFHLFTVPVVNNQRIQAQPITCDGSQERYAIRHPEPQFGYMLQKVLGVYEASDQGMLPLRPGILAGGNGSYEIEQGAMQEGGGYLYWLIPHYPAAFEQSRILLIDALWQQPWYDQILQNPYTIHAFRRQMQGIQWDLLDDAIAHTENNQLDNISRYIHLLTLMHHTCLDGQNVSDILLALGSVSSGHFQKIYNSLLKVRLEEEPYGDSNKTRQIYHLQFKPLLDDSTELIEPFVRHVGRVLDLWLTDAMVETRWEIEDENNMSIGL